MHRLADDCDDHASESRAPCPVFIYSRCSKCLMLANFVLWSRRSWIICSMHKALRFVHLKLYVVLRYRLIFSRDSKIRCNREISWSVRIAFLQARSQILRFGGTRCILGARFLFLLFAWNKFSWAQHNLGGTAPECPLWLNDMLLYIFG